MFHDALKYNFVEKVRKAAEPRIWEERQKYAPVLTTALAYCKKNKIYLDVQHDVNLEKDIADGKIDTLSIFSHDPQKTAKEISSLICKENGNKLNLSVVFEKKEYLIRYDTRIMINIYEILGAVPELKIGGFYIFPPILELINKLMDLIDVKNFDDWADHLIAARQLEKLIKFENIVPDKNDKKTVKDIRVLLLQYFAGSNHVLLDDDPETPLEIISNSRIEDISAEITGYMDKYTNAGFFYKNAEVNLPKQDRFSKISVFVSTEGRPIAHVYNLATYTLVPFKCVNEKNLRIAAPVVQTFIHLINIWVTYNNDKYTRKYDYDNYCKYSKIMKIEKLPLIGTYIDSVIQKKIAKLQLRKTSSERSAYSCEDLETT